MSGVQLSFVLRPDGTVVFSAKRADGTMTWQKHVGPNARFFPFHDLTHFAVETELGAREGFYGLLAAGWDIGDTEGKGSRGALPHEAILVEHLVGMFDRERIGGAPPMDSDQFRANLQLLVNGGQIAAAPTLTTEQLSRVRKRIGELRERWAMLAAMHQPLVLAFEIPARSGLMPEPAPTANP